MSAGNRAFVGPSNREYADLRGNGDTYTLSSSLLVMVVPPDGTAFEPDRLRAFPRSTFFKDATRRGRHAANLPRQPAT